MQWFIEPSMTVARAEDANPSKIQEQGTLISWGIWHNHPQIVLQGKGSPYKLGREKSMSGYVNANKLSLVGAEKTNILQSQQRASKGTSSQALQMEALAVRLGEGFHLR